MTPSSVHLLAVDTDPVTGAVCAPSGGVKRATIIISRPRHGGAVIHLAGGLFSRGVEPPVICFLQGELVELLTAGKGRYDSVGQASRDWAIQEFGVARMVSKYLEVYGGEVERKPRKGGA